MLSTRLSPPVTDSGREWRLRRELTDFYHLIDFLGWTELIFNHISVRLPGAAHHYLVNPFGLNYTGNHPRESAWQGGHRRRPPLLSPLNIRPIPAGFALHGAIHESRPDVACVAHTHTHGGFSGRHEAPRVDSITIISMERNFTAVSAITILRASHCTPRSAAGCWQVSSDKHVLVLRNHGIAVCYGARYPHDLRAVLWTVQRAAEIQCQDVCARRRGRGLESEGGPTALP